MDNMGPSSGWKAAYRRAQGLKARRNGQDRIAEATVNRAEPIERPTDLREGRRPGRAG
jgi:hypothetical protein